MSYTRHLRVFNNHAEYENYMAGNPLLPNVSVCLQEMHVHYNPIPPDRWVEAVFDVYSTTSATTILYNGAVQYVTEMYIDGVKLDNVVYSYKFSSKGSHTVRYNIKGQKEMPNMFPYIERVTSITIPKGIESIAEEAACNAYLLRYVQFPNSLKTVKRRAFGTSNLRDTTSVPAKYIQDHAFSLSSIANGSALWLSNVETIGQQAFQRCDVMTGLVIGENCVFIGDSAFSGCSALTGITVEATTPPTIGTNVFNNTNNCPIYVPENSVQTYKSVWSVYADRIQAIQGPQPDSPL